MIYHFDNDRPIYKQLVEQLEIAIVNGTYQPGEKLSSVRELASITKVNPNTIQKALQELETMNLVYTKRTSGRYVTEDQQLIKKRKAVMATKMSEQFLKNMNALGVSEKEAIIFLGERGKQK